MRGSRPNAGPGLDGAGASAGRPAPAATQATRSNADSPPDGGLSRVCVCACVRVCVSTRLAGCRGLPEPATPPLALPGAGYPTRVAEKRQQSFSGLGSAAPNALAQAPPPTGCGSAPSRIGTTIVAVTRPPLGTAR